MVEIHNLIAAISPDIYCDSSVRSKVKALVKEKGYLDAAKEAKLVKSDILYNYDSAKKDPFSRWGLKSPIEKHQIEYDSATESLEPLYFWILDFMNKAFKSVDKLTDNFVSSPGSAYFSELGAKATRMQEEAMKMFGTANTVLKSIINMVYDLKEFKIRLDAYDRLKDGKQKESALLSLKQIWLDSVDIKRGTTSIKGMMQQFDYVTLIDAFMASNSIDDVKKLDLNDRVKRILMQRVPEFLKWVKESEGELRKRFEIETKYLKSQVNALKLYSRWIKPYLKAAKQLEQNASAGAGLVTAFNTLILELSLLAKDNYDPKDDVDLGILPQSFLKATKRKYHPVVIVEFNFRGIPQRVGQGYSFGGRTSIKFTSYALNNDELKVLKEQMEKDDVDEAMSFIEGSTTESLDQINADIEMFTGEKKEQNKEEKKSEDVNPFTALFSFAKKEKKEQKTDLSKGIPSDTDYEKVIRSQAIIEARSKCFTLFDTYKKSHGMPSHADPFKEI